MQIQITRQYSTPSATSYKLVLVATGTEMPSEIFKMYQQPLDPLTGSGTIDTFVSVCTASELSSLPINSPSDTSDSLFRTSTLNLILDDASDLQTAWTDIQTAVADLLADLKAIEQLSTPVTVTFS